jgi:hypothetical protein
MLVRPSFVVDVLDASRAEVALASTIASTIDNTNGSSSATRGLGGGNGASYTDVLHLSVRIENPSAWTAVADSRAFQLRSDWDAQVDRARRIGRAVAADRVVAHACLHGEEALLTSMADPRRIDSASASSCGENGGSSIHPQSPPPAFLLAIHARATPRGGGGDGSSIESCLSLFSKGMIDLSNTTTDSEMQAALARLQRAAACLDAELSLERQQSTSSDTATETAFEQLTHDLVATATASESNATAAAANVLALLEALGPTISNRRQRQEASVPSLHDYDFAATKLWPHARAHAAIFRSKTGNFSLPEEAKGIEIAVPVMDGSPSPTVAAPHARTLCAPVPYGGRGDDAATLCTVAITADDILAAAADDWTGLFMPASASDDDADAATARDTSSATAASSRDLLATAQRALARSLRRPSATASSGDGSVALPLHIRFDRATPWAAAHVELMLLPASWFFDTSSSTAVSSAGGCDAEAQAFTAACAGTGSTSPISSSDGADQCVAAVADIACRNALRSPALSFPASRAAWARWVRRANAHRLQTAAPGNAALSTASSSAFHLVQEELPESPSDVPDAPAVDASLPFWSQSVLLQRFGANLATREATLVDEIADPTANLTLDTLSSSLWFSLIPAAAGAELPSASAPSSVNIDNATNALTRLIDAVAAVRSLVAANSSAVALLSALTPSAGAGLPLPLLLIARGGSVSGFSSVAAPLAVAALDVSIDGGFVPMPDGWDGAATLPMTPSSVLYAAAAAALHNAAVLQTALRRIILSAGALMAQHALTSGDVSFLFTTGLRGAGILRSVSTATAVLKRDDVIMPAHHVAVADLSDLVRTWITCLGLPAAVAAVVEKAANAMNSSNDKTLNSTTFEEVQVPPPLFAMGPVSLLMLVALPLVDAAVDATAISPLIAATRRAIVADAGRLGVRRVTPSGSCAAFDASSSLSPSSSAAARSGAALNVPQEQARLFPTRERAAAVLLGERTGTENNEKSIDSRSAGDVSSSTCINYGGSGDDIFTIIVDALASIGAAAASHLERAATSSSVASAATSPTFPFSVSDRAATATSAATPTDTSISSDGNPNVGDASTPTVAFGPTFGPLQMRRVDADETGRSSGGVALKYSDSLRVGFTAFGAALACATAGYFALHVW